MASKPLPVSITTLNNWIQAKRLEKNLAICHLAAKKGIASAVIKSLERGASEPDARQWQLLGSLLGCRCELSTTNPTEKLL
jgi:ribosome-binding protein aMBF1 (putative translation factor)